MHWRLPVVVGHVGVLLGVSARQKAGRTHPQPRHVLQRNHHRHDARPTAEGGVWVCGLPGRTRVGDQCSELEQLSAGPKVLHQTRPERAYELV
eukprot:scaffold263_cov120-Isochrysis_galbana.AAC.18